MPSLFDSGSDSTGWIAAVIAALAYGTYGVPIKATKKLPIHPLVFQSYKTCTMFILCWMVLLMGIPFSFSPWGILSGLLWVLGGTGGIVAVRYAGMAVAVGTWASVMICVNFVWGILVFEEPVANMYGTMFAFVLLTIGLVGMSTYSQTTPQPTTTITPGRTNKKHQKSYSAGDLPGFSFPGNFPGKPIYPNFQDVVVVTTHINNNGIDTLPPPPPPPPSSQQNQSYHNTLEDDVGDYEYCIEDEEEEEEELVYPGSAVVKGVKKLVAKPWGSLQNFLEVRTYSDLLEQEEIDRLLLLEQEEREVADEYGTDALSSLNLQWEEAITTSDDKDGAYGSVADNMVVSANPVNIEFDDHLARPVTLARSNSLASRLSNHHRRLLSMTKLDVDETTTVDICGVTLSKRTFGIIGAVFNGIMTGTSFIPVHYAKKLGFGGAHYMISYAVGALLSNIVLWILYVLYIFLFYSSSSPTPLSLFAGAAASLSSQMNLLSSTSFQNFNANHNGNLTDNRGSGHMVETKSGSMPTEYQLLTQFRSRHPVSLQTRIRNTYRHLPKLYLKQMWFPGFMAGLFLTTAMFGTLLAVTYLGQGVGNSVIQAKILVSGMWGIFWYKEINDRDNVRKWFLSASFTIAGILWLSFERLEAEKVQKR